MTSTSQILEESIKKMLSPIAAFCIRNSVRLQPLIAIIKEVLIEAAVSDLEKNKESVSVSRISVMTGLHRADISAIYRLGQKKEVVENVTSRVIDRWHQDPRFCTKNNKPKVLALDGMNSQFIELVRSVSSALNPYTVLFELERTGVVQRTAHGLKLCTRVYVPKDTSEAYSLLADDTRDLIFAVSENLGRTQGSPNLHVKTEYDNIPLKYSEQIRHWLLKEGSAFHRKARTFLARFDRDFKPEKEKSKGRLRVVIGSFSRSENIEDK